MPNKLHDWKAVANMMPPGPHSLRVTGKVTAHAGQTAKLAPAKPGINPDILILALTIEGRGAGPADIVGMYEDKNYKGHFKQVTIRDNTDSVTVDVKIVL
jgi:hypothetical protein